MCIKVKYTHRTGIKTVYRLRFLFELICMQTMQTTEKKLLAGTEEHS